MTADRVGGISGLGQRVQNDLVQAIGVAAVAGMHHQFRNGYCRAAALGAVFAESLGLGADAAVKLDVRTEHAVAVQDIAGADRLAEMGGDFRSIVLSSQFQISKDFQSSKTAEQSQTVSVVQTCPLFPLSMIFSTMSST